MKKEKKVLNNQKISVFVEIEDRDIATIEALHDLLLDAHGYSLDFITLKRARELTAKMHKQFDIYKKTMKNKQDVINCLRKRDKDAFNNPYHKNEHREINVAIEIIERLMPPSYFTNDLEKHK